MNNIFTNEELKVVATLRGGVKAKWLRDNHERVLDYCEAFSESVARFDLHLKQDTLERLIATPIHRQYEKKTNAYRANLKADTALNAIEGLEKKLSMQETRVDMIKAQQEDIIKGQRNLVELFGQFRESVSQQVGASYVLPMLQNLIQFSGNLPEIPNPLSIDTLIEQATKTVKRLNERSKSNGNQV